MFLCPATQTATRFWVAVFCWFFNQRFGKTKKGSYFCALGEMAEWSIAAVLKTVDLHGSGGSNPSLSANKGVNQVVTRFTPIFTPKNQGWVYFF